MSEKEAKEIWVTKFDEDHAQKFREAVMNISKHDPNVPIIIYIDSYGGQVYSLAKMIETIDEVPNIIITACLGKAMSCGAVLLSHGDVRFLGKHSKVMIHEVSGGAWGNVHDMKTDTKEAHDLNVHFMGLLARNCKLKNYKELRKVLKNLDGRDLYLTGKKALQFGIVDFIGTPKLYASTSYHIVNSVTNKIIGSKKAGK